MPIYDRFGSVYGDGPNVIDPALVETARLRAASPHLLHINGAAQMNTGIVLGDEPGEYQPFPSTAAGLIAALGATGVILPANVLAIYQCDTATPLVDSLGLGPNLVAAGGPLTGRECVGLPTATFNSKVGCEFQENSVAQRFQSAVPLWNVPVGGFLSLLVVMRCGTDGTLGVSRGIMGSGVAVDRAWSLWAYGNQLAILGWDSVAGYYFVALLVGIDQYNGAWQSVAVVLDGATTIGSLFTSLGDVAGAAWLANLNGTGRGQIGSGSIGGATSAHCQIAYIAQFDVALTSAQRATFWRAFNPAALGTPNTYARLNPLIVPITASRVACYAGGNVGQLAVGYSAGFLTDGNAGRTGILCEDGATFEPIGSTNLYGLSGVVGFVARASADGPSGMRDGQRVTMGAAWGVAAFAITPAAPGVAIVGASNIPWRADVNYRRATVNTTARLGLYYTGSAAAAEFFTLVADAASPVDWTRNGGTCTPVNADQTAAYVATGAAALNDDCDFGEPTLIKNRTFANLAWRRVGTAAAATSTPTLSYLNTGNRRYSPIRGAIELKLSGFGLTNGATFLQIGAAAAAGSVTLDYNAGGLRLRWYDNTPALTATVLCGPLDATQWHLKISFDHATPVPGAGGAYIIVERINVGASPTVLGTWLAGWTIPTADVTPIMVGTDAAGANSARCFVSLA